MVEKLDKKTNKDLSQAEYYRYHKKSYYANKYPEKLVKN